MTVNLKKKIIYDLIDASKCEISQDVKSWSDTWWLEIWDLKA